MKKKTRIIDLSLMFHDGMQTYHKNIIQNLKELNLLHIKVIIVKFQQFK